MASILRALRPIRNECKKLVTTEDLPPMSLTFETFTDQDNYIQQTELFINTIKTRRATLFALHSKLLEVDCKTEADQRAVDLVVDEDSLILLQMDGIAEQYSNHLRRLEREASRRTTQPDNSVYPPQNQPAIQQPAQTQVNHTYANGTRNANTVKLPKLELKRFKGDVSLWQAFWDSFEAAVHTNGAVSTVDKFNYLKGFLEGDAYAAIDGLALTAENYTQAVFILKNRFGNKQTVITSHYSALTRLPTASENTTSIRSVVDTLEKHFRSLEAIGEDVNHNQFISMILAKLPTQFIMRLEETRGDTAWTVTSLRAKLQQLLAARETAEQHQKFASSNQTHSQKKFIGPKFNGSQSTVSSLMTISDTKRLPPSQCVYCKGNHWSDECKACSTIDSRKQRIKGKCFLCLQVGHNMKDCRKDRACYHCKEKDHHRSLCPKKFPQKKATNKKHVPNPSAKSETACTVGEGQKEEVNTENLSDGTNIESALVNMDERGVLQTAKAFIISAHAKTAKGEHARIVLDCGSQRTYITQELAQKLQAKSYGKERLQLYPFGASEPKYIETDAVKLEMTLLDGTKFKFIAHTVSKIGDVHHPAVDMSKFGPLYKSIALADPVQKDANGSRTIDLLIGNNYFWDLVTSEKIQLTKGLYLIGSKLGWVISGRINDTVTWYNKPSLIMMTQVTNAPITQQPYIEADPPLLSNLNLQDWWSLEAIGIKELPQDTSDDKALTKFNDTVQYVDQRYQVTWPWKENVDHLPTNYALALGRLNSLIRRLKGNPDLLAKYDEIIQMQLQKDIIEKVPLEGNPNNRKHYLPHHPVITPDKNTTKVRIVYDGSAKANKSSPSINECMHRGPVILDDVCALLIRFRLHRVAMTADIEKAFLQVALQPDERDITRFLWMKNPSKLTADNNLEVFRFTRVPFGIISSPFLLGATIRHHLMKNGTSVAMQICKSIYVDNMITGTDNTDNALEFYKVAKTLFQSASMNLREWLSNDTSLMQQIPEEDRINKPVAKVLGMLWDTKMDTLRLVNGLQLENTEICSKRTVLKTLAKVFDPLGLWSPAMLKAKLFLQSLWLKEKEWDSILNIEDLTTWNAIIQDASMLSSVSIPRFIGQSVMHENFPCELHCFTDASAKAYGACVYLKVQHSTNTSITLLFAKSRVAPNRKITLPRMELLATTIGGRLIHFVDKSLLMPVTKRFIWTDSQCILHWLKSSKPLSVFVSNRIRELQTLKDIEFRYVPTDQNPADLCSRGCSAAELQSSNLWWHGPAWLLADKTQWPPEANQFCIDDQTITKISSEEKNSVVFEASLLGGTAMKADSPFGINSSKFSNLTKLLRVTAWCMQFCERLKANENNQAIASQEMKSDKHTLNADQITAAKMLWIKNVQKEHYSDVFRTLKKGNNIPLQTQLGLWIDKEGVLRCKGRLINANLDENATHPILLPKRCWFTSLIIQSYHEKLFHSGVAHTLSQIRHEFWIPAGRAEVYKQIKSCLKCKRFEGGPYKAPQIPALPKSRVTESPPFTWTGLDFLGPLHVKHEQNTQKMWICLFTCMSTRAIHLELVEDLTSQQFLLALKRFVARRGMPAHIWSDNAKTFKLAKSTIDHLFKKILFDENVLSYVSKNGIKWLFIPERAPWMGGFYERLVQSVKRALRKSIQNVCLTTAQLQTVITEIESMLNSRPLVHVGADFKDGTTLTPAHFLSLNPKIGMPEGYQTDKSDPDYLEHLTSKERLLHAWLKGQQHLKAFWKVWKDEYLLNLRERMQTHLTQQRGTIVLCPKLGDVVHIRSDAPRGSWPLARIIELIKSSDGEIRTAKVQLPSRKVLTRAIAHLFPMECEGAEYEKHVNSQIPTASSIHNHKNAITQISSASNSQEQVKGTQKQPKSNQRPTRKAAQKAKRKIRQLAKNLTSDETDAYTVSTSTSLYKPSIFLMLMCILTVFTQPSMSLQPLLCEKGNAKFTLNLTDSYSCAINPDHKADKDRVYLAKLAIYKRNIAKYSSPAYKCSKVRTIIEAYTNFAKAGWDHRKRDEEIAVSESECQTMIKERRCREGPLLGGETMAYTENKIEPPYSTGNAWDCCKWLSKDVINCFIVQGTVYQTFHGHMESNLANVADCNYSKESCILHDQSLLTWKINKTATCEFVYWQTVEGKLWNKQFLSNDYEIALTWSQSPSIQLCDGIQAILTEQGLPVQILASSYATPVRITRPRRQAEESDSVAIRLQAMEMRLQLFLKESLNQAFWTVCRSIKEVQQFNLLLAHAEPTLVARRLLHDQNIMGRLQGPILEVWACNPVDSFIFLKMEKQCSEWIPVNFTAKGKNSLGYMDPKTRIIYANSAPAECDLAQETYIYDEQGNVWVYSAHNGVLKSFTGSLIQHALHTLALQPYTNFKTIVHKPLQMYTQAELRGQISLNDIFNLVENHASILKELTQVVDKPSSAEANAILETVSRYTPMGILNQLANKLHWIWIQCCCILVTLKLMWTIIKYITIRKCISLIKKQEVITQVQLESSSLITAQKSPIAAAMEAMCLEERS